MSKKLNSKPLIIPDGHTAPVTRRDFLKYGVIPFAGSLLAPSLLSQILFQGKALAQDSQCGSASSNAYMPFLIFDMAGGAALPGNFLVGKKGGPEDLMSSYDTLGWNPKAANAVDTSFGLPMARNQSQILAGIRQTASTQALALLKMGSFCHFSLDDTGSNKTSALSLIARAGLQGKFLQTGVGTRNTLSGGNSDVALQETLYKPTFVQSILDIQSSVSSGSAFNDLSEDEIKALNRAIYEMSATQIRQFNGLTEVQKLSQLAGCGYKSNLAIGKIVTELSPLSNQNAVQVYQINQNNPTNENSVFASVAYNVIQGHTGPGVITIGGCDYHDGSQTTGDGKDREMGQQIGRAVELAYRLQKPLFFQLLTDGGVSSTPGTRNWTSDSNLRSMTVIGYFNPKRAPEQRRVQVGEYTDGQTVNQNTLVGDEPSKVANAVLANYLSACGKINEFEKVAQTVFRNSDLDSILIF